MVRAGKKEKRKIKRDKKKERRKHTWRGRRRSFPWNVLAVQTKKGRPTALSHCLLRPAIESSDAVTHPRCGTDFPQAVASQVVHNAPAQSAAAPRVQAPWHLIISLPKQEGGSHGPSYRQRMPHEALGQEQEQEQEHRLCPGSTACSHAPSSDCLPHGVALEGGAALATHCGLALLVLFPHPTLYKYK